MTTAAVYVRVSSRKQAMAEKTSLADQEKECRAYATRESWPVAGAFIDTMTGYETMDQRPALQEVRKLIQTSGADVLIVWRYDRAARDQIDLLMLAREVNAVGARLISATEGAMENTATGRMLLGVLGGAAEIEREAIIARTQGAIRTRAEAGKLLIGGAPKYGYVYAGDRKERYEINPETAPVVQRIYDLADAGKSLHDITRILNDEGIPPPSRYLAEKGHSSSRTIANTWRRQGVYVLLKDPTYMGQHIAYRRKRVKGKTVLVFRDETDERRIVQAVPALVSVEQWQRVQAALSEHMLRRNSATDPEQMPLLNRGIAYCGHCGAKCIGAKHQRGYFGYRCQNRTGQTDGDRPGCPGGSWFIKAEDVDADVWAKVAEMASDTDRFQQMIEAPMREAQARLGQIEKQEQTLADELEQARKDRDTISRRMATEEDDAIAATFRARLKETMVLIARLEARVGAQDRKAERVQARMEVIRSAINIAKSKDTVGYRLSDTGESVAVSLSSGTLPTFTRDQKRNLLRAIGACVCIYSGKSDYARDNGKRWELQIIPDVDLPNESARGYIPSHTLIYTWADWLRARKRHFQQRDSRTG